MTVAELRERLKHVPDDMVVISRDEDGDYTDQPVVGVGTFYRHREGYFYGNRLPARVGEGDGVAFQGILIS